MPGDTLGGAIGTSDWQAVFSGMACYCVTSPQQQRDLVVAVAALADEAGFPLLVDLRPGLVIIDSGKDQWEDGAHGLELDFADLAAAVQTAARELGATADPRLPRMIQLFLDAADVDAVRAFWVAALGYTHDQRAGVSDIFDPRRLNPVLVFRELDASETERRRQRNRTHFELEVPSDVAQTRLATTVAAGGRLLDESQGRSRIADPEGNELVIVNGAGGRVQRSVASSWATPSRSGVPMTDEPGATPAQDPVKIVGLDPGTNRGRAHLHPYLPFSSAQRSPG